MRKNSVYYVSSLLSQLLRKVQVGLHRNLYNIKTYENK